MLKVELREENENKGLFARRKISKGTEIIKIEHANLITPEVAFEEWKGCDAKNTISRI